MVTDFGLEYSDFQVGEGVFYRPPLKDPGNYVPGEILPGIIISRFWGDSCYIYRIELERVYAKISDGRLGQKIIVGNVYPIYICSKI